MTKAMLMDIKRFAIHDGPGIRTTFFLKGCPLRCIWCHNPEGISARPEVAYYARKCVACGSCAEVCPQGAHKLTDGMHEFDRSRCKACGKCVEECAAEALRLFGKETDIASLVKIALEDAPFYTHSGGGVTVSGGEPLLQADLVRELFTELKKHNINTAVDTCGSVPWEAYEKMLPLTDIFLFDIKHIDSAEHEKLTGAGNERILDNLRRLSAAGARIEIRMPLVPKCNNSEETLRKIGMLLGGLNIEKMRVLPYHSMARSKYAALGREDTMPDVPSPANDELNRAVEILREYGVNAVSGRE